MNGHCRACGDRLGERNPFALEILNLRAWPDWLDGLCLGCLYELQCGENEPVTPSDLNAYLADLFVVYAQRAAKGLPLDRCEVVRSQFMGDPIMNCRRFHIHKIGGRSVCGIHFGLSKRGIALQFVEQDRRQPQPYVIWARDGQELIAEAHRLSAESPLLCEMVS